MANDLSRDLNALSNIGNEQEFEVLQGKKAIQQYEMCYVIQADGEVEEFILGGSSLGFLDLMDDLMEVYLEEKTKKVQISIDICKWPYTSAAV